MSELTQCICGYEAAGISDRIAHQLHCDKAKAEADWLGEYEETPIDPWKVVSDVDRLREQQAARIAALEAELLLREDVMRHYEADLAQARLLLVAIDENLDMDVNPMTYTTKRIVELLRDPAGNPWATLMRAGLRGEGPQGWESREGGA